MMSDFDERLSAVLTAEAEAAPHSVGLAEAARRRHVVRRRRVAIGGAAAVLAVAAPVVVLALGGNGGDDDLTGADTTAPAGAWQTVAEGDARAEIPGDWSKFTCDFDGFEKEVFGPSEEDACGFASYLAFYGSATFDPAHLSGEIVGDGSNWGGYVYAGDLAVSSSTTDRDLTRRILGSARLSGEPEIDASVWRSVEGVGLRVDIPSFWGLGPDQQTRAYAVCAVPGEPDERPDTTDRTPGAEDAYLSLDFRHGRWISVSAPTQAIGDLVLASVASTPGSAGIGCVPDRFGQ